MTSSNSPIQLYNTMSKSKQVFTPLDEKNVRMYVCGPTVYDYAHIGNARPAIVFDVLFRLLRHVFGENHVTYLRNITDVDDKINARAARDFPNLSLNEAIKKLTKTTEQQYQSDMSELGCLEPSGQPRATDHIAEMITMIEELIAKGHAYEAEGHVLFAVKSYTQDDEVKYGRLARRSLDDMIAGARVEVAPYKRDPMDFVLWKPSDAGLPGWDSPWSKGRPGWHIECSAMSKKYLGEVFDIHGGGIDLSFPHHENELAQSCCANGTDQMAQIWMHNGFLQINGEKMSKSEGNFFTVNELLHTEEFGGRKWPGDVLRLAMLMTHYRKPIDFSVARLEEASIELSKMKTAVGYLEFNSESDPAIDFMAALENDLNTPAAIASLQRLRHSIMNDARDVTNRAADEIVMIDEDRGNEVDQLLAGLKLLGIDIQNYNRNWLQNATQKLHESGENAGQIEAAIAQRLTRLADKNWAEADKIRDELAAKGIKLIDGKDSETGARTTTWEVVK